ncbi:hypothetical protein AVEN_108838-1 [Araneus ventricosus]|uniref:Uncharacterized protein n=1 Tax=Araneus ventricosus TaxID=182803 RepID=A0A4Y2CD21_ARAVE|nr:hypothetical protein AVEN_108838-1 [Araneus ventricosus]
MMAERLFAYCFPLPWFRSAKKKDAAPQAGGTDFIVRNAIENSESGSSNSFYDDCVADGTYILNPSDDPMKNVPQSPMDYKIHCQEWVQKHREYHTKKLRSFSI